MPSRAFKLHNILFFCGSLGFVHRFEASRGSGQTALRSVTCGFAFSISLTFLQKGLRAEKSMHKSKSAAEKRESRNGKHPESAGIAFGEGAKDEKAVAKAGWDGSPRAKPFACGSDARAQFGSASKRDLRHVEMRACFVFPRLRAGECAIGKVCAARKNLGKRSLQGGARAPTWGASGRIARDIWLARDIWRQLRVFGG